MNDILIITIMIFGNLLNTCLHTFFYYKTIGLSHKCKGYRLVIVILFIAVILAVETAIGSFTLWGIVLCFIIVILYPIIFMGGRFKERILFGIVSCLMTQFSNIISFAIVSPDMMWDLSKFTRHIPLLICALITNVVYAILMMFIIHLDTVGKRYIPRKYWTGIIICSVIMIVCVTTVFNLDSWLADDSKLYTYTIVFTLGFLVIWILLYFVFYFICKYFSKVNEANMLAIQNDMIERYTLQKQASEERIKILSHDLKHSLVQWRALAVEKGDTAALQSISEYERQLLSSLLLNVEHESANAIINQKCLEAHQAQVEFLVDGVFHNDLLISRLDICSLLGNLLDNAIEAAAKAETEALRLVKLSIKRKGNLLILVVENGYAAEPVLENGVFVTHKKDKEHHAIGTLSIHYVADKYNGAVNNTFESNWFKSTVMLNGYQDILSDKY